MLQYFIVYSINCFFSRSDLIINFKSSTSTKVPFFLSKAEEFIFIINRGYITHENQREQRIHTRKTTIVQQIVE
jgi:hypothetical protein